MRRQASRSSGDLFGREQPLTVTEIATLLKGSLERAFPLLRVEGEISNLKRFSSGHWYFTLKDEGAQLQAVCFRNANRLIRFVPENGMRVVARGAITFYDVQGTLQMRAEWLEPAGIGALHQAFERQKQRLEGEGLFESGRKRELPVFPRRVGIVTSLSGAVLQDILRVLERRSPGLDVVIAPVKVQGAGAAAEIADGIDALNRLRSERPDYPIDVLIVGRGGGSIEDLWAFNEEVVARAIFRSAIPVVSAVGHETDTTIADFVADLRAATPSVAAETVSAGVVQLRHRLDAFDASFARQIRFRLLSRKSDLDSLLRPLAEFRHRPARMRARVGDLNRRIADALRGDLRDWRRQLRQTEEVVRGADPRQALAERRGRLGLLDSRISQSVARLLAARGAALSTSAARLDALSPLRVLGRGYTLVRDGAGHLVTRAATLSPGDDVRVLFADGEAACRVIAVPETDG